MTWSNKRIALCLFGLLACAHGASSRFLLSKQVIWGIRGGNVADASAAVETDETPPKELSLDEKVANAMKKLGLSPPELEEDGEEECAGGICAMPDEASGDKASAAAKETPAATVQAEEPSVTEENAHEIAARIAKDMNVDKHLALAALGATAGFDGEKRTLNEDFARQMIQQELDEMAHITEDCDEVKQLVSEGNDVFLSRRALAFAEMNMDDARAILLADKMDAEEEAAAAAATAEKTKEEDTETKVREQLRAEAAQAKQAPPPTMKTVTVDANFDPTAPAAGGLGSATAAPGNPSMEPPTPAKKSDVVFECTTAQVQELVLESPVPCLVDVYADWCGPCKHLGPILEEMAVKAGGVFRLIKVNTDNERAVSGALEVTALPTVFAVRDGKVLNNFQGMPRSEDMMRNFMMGLLMPGQSFDPPVTAEQKKKFDELSTKLAKVAGAASFSFSARERLQDRMATRLDELVSEYDGNMADSEDSAKVVRSLLSNVIRNPHDPKYRKVNLVNKVIAAKVATFPSCIAILKSVGFVSEGSDSMVIAKNKKVVNIAPVTIARDCIDKWIDKNRATIAAANRKRKDEIARARLAEEAANRDDEEEEEEEEEEEVDPDLTTLRVRIGGKKKVHELNLHVDEPLSSIIDALPVSVGSDEDIQVICTAKKLVVSTSDEAAMKKSLRDHRLQPAAAVVVKIGSGEKRDSSTSLKERAAAQKNRKKGSHTMQSIGVYAKDDNAKGELVDGGGGVLYEQDVTDDEDEGLAEGSSSEDAAEADESEESEA